MPIPQVLASFFNTTLGATTTQLYLYRGGERTPFGNAVASNGEAYSGTEVYMNKVVRFKNGIYVIVETTGSAVIRRSLDFGQTWTTVFSNANTQDNRYLQVLELNGVATLCALMQTSSSAFLMAKSTDGVTWTSTTTTSLGTLDNTHIVAAIFENDMYLIPTGTSSAQLYYIFLDFEQMLAWRSVTTFASANAVGTMCVFNGKLYYAKMDSTSSTTTSPLFEIDKQYATQVATFTHGAGTGGGGFTKWTMFTDNTNMYLFLFANSTPDVWRIYQITTALAITDITTAVRPAFLANTSGTTTTQRCMSMVDCVTDPTTPQPYVFAITNSTNVNTAFTMWNIFQWNGPASLMTLVDVGGEATDVLTWGALPQGAPFFTVWSNDQYPPHVEIVNRATQTNSTIIMQFTLYSQTGSQLVDVRGFFGDGLSAYSETQATLTNASAGTIIANTITGLVADNGATVYEVTWQSGTDGITGGERYIFNFEVQLQ